MCTPSGSADTTVRQTPLTARLSPVASSRRERGAEPQPEAARRRLHLGDLADGFNQPVNITLDHHVVARAAACGRRQVVHLDAAAVEPRHARRRRATVGVMNIWTRSTSPRPGGRVQRGTALDHQRRHAQLRQQRQRVVEEAVRVVRRDELDPGAGLTQPLCPVTLVLAARLRCTTITGPAPSVESSRAVGGVRSRRSKTTRVSGRAR